MDTEEIKDYLGDKSLYIYIPENFIDNTDIDNPVKTFVKIATAYNINVDDQSSVFLQLKQNTFYDNTNRLQTL